MTPRKYIAWARVSSARQASEGWSLEYQQERLRDYAERNGGEIVKMYVVTETASKQQERKVFREMLAYAKLNRGKIDGLLVMKIDRAARNMHDFLALEKLEEDYGVRLISVTQPTENTPSGRMMRRTFATFATFFTEQLSVDIKAAYKRRVQAGLFGTQTPYGYKHVRGDDGKSVAVVVDWKAANVRRIFELYAYHNHTLDSLAAAVKSEGMTYTEAQPYFVRSKLYEILTNRAYIGEVQHLGVWYPGIHQPIVDRETFDRVQHLLGRRMYRSHEMLYAGGLIKCGHCGRPISGEAKTKITTRGEHHYTYYRCAGYNAEGHPRIRLREQELDEQVLAMFDRMRVDDELKSLIADTIRAMAESEQGVLRENRHRISAELTRVRNQKDQLLNLRLAGDVDQETYGKKMLELRDRETHLQVELDKAGRDQSEEAELTIKTFELSQNLREKWVTSDREAKRRLLEIVCLNFTLSDVSLVPTMREPFDVLAEGLNFAFSAQELTSLEPVRRFLNGVRRIPEDIRRLIAMAA